MSTLNEHSEFRDIVAQLVSEDIEGIVETGTCRGLGSTQIFAKTGIPVDTIECNQENYQSALRNLSPYSNVKCHYGYSLGKKEMVDFIRNDIYEYPKEVRKDHAVPVKFYLHELQGAAPENCLLPLIGTQSQLIFLDSAGGVGWLEYQMIMNLDASLKARKWLLLDDVWHVKHYRSMLDLRARGYTVNLSSDNRLLWVAL